MHTFTRYGFLKDVITFELLVAIRTQSEVVRSRTKTANALLSYISKTRKKDDLISANPSYKVDPFEVDYDSNDLTSADRNRWFKSWLNATDQKLNEDEAAEAAFFSNAWADALAEKLHERHGCRAHVVPLRYELLLCQCE